MIDLLLGAGLKHYDLAMLILCPLAAAIGSFAHTILQTINPHRMPGKGSTQFLTGRDAAGRFAWILLRLTLGAILGLVIALYFVGAIQENIATLAKIVALSILVGYAAPKLWVAQEKILAAQVDRHIDALVKAKRDDAPPPPA